MQSEVMYVAICSALLVEREICRVQAPPCQRKCRILTALRIGARPGSVRSTYSLRVGFLQRTVRANDTARPCPDRLRSPGLARSAGGARLAPRSRAARPRSATSARCRPTARSPAIGSATRPSPAATARCSTASPTRAPTTRSASPSKSRPARAPAQSVRFTRTFCMATCESDADCRAGYACLDVTTDAGAAGIGHQPRDPPHLYGGASAATRGRRECRSRLPSAAPSTAASRVLGRPERSGLTPPTPNLASDSSTPRCCRRCCRSRRRATPD